MSGFLWINFEVLYMVFGLIALYRILRATSFHTVWMIKTYLPSFYRHYTFPKNYGEWAAVTGCTSGIGLSLVKEIANRGINLVLISRSQDKLKSLANELESLFKVKVKVIVNDAANRESTNYMAKELEKLDIGILVNNVGINFEEKLVRFDQSKPQWIYNMITVNTGNATLAVKHVLPSLIRAKRGLVVNMCSSSSYTPVPAEALYSATKVYMDIFTRAVGYEVESSGVHIQSYCPLLVQSNMTYKASNFIYNFCSVSGKTYAKSFVDTFGTCKRTGGFWFFDLIYGLGLIVMNTTIMVYAVDILTCMLTKPN